MGLSYTAFLTPAEEGGYTVEIPRLPGCISEGDTFEEALVNIREAMELWLEVRREHGDHVPEPDSDALKVEIPLSV